MPATQLINVALEEIEYSDTDSSWNITIGFDTTKVIKRSGAQLGLLGLQPPTTEETERKYKLLKIDDRTGNFISMKIREI